MVLITHTCTREFTKKNVAQKGSQNLGTYFRLDKEKWAWVLAAGRGGKLWDGDQETYSKQGLLSRDCHTD